MLRTQEVPGMLLRLTSEELLDRYATHAAGTGIHPPGCLSFQHQNMEQVSKVLTPDNLCCATLAAGSVVDIGHFSFKVLISKCTYRKAICISLE